MLRLESVKSEKSIFNNKRIRIFLIKLMLRFKPVFQYNQQNLYSRINEYGFF